LFSTPTGDRRFESSSLQRRVRNEPAAGATNPVLDTTIVGTINPEPLQTNLGILE
jgi:hypothetical protein